MALLKQDNMNNYGVKEEYWKISAINIDTILNTCNITLVGYHNEEARRNGSEPMSTRTVRSHWGETQFKRHFSTEALDEKNIYEAAYDFCKLQHNFFIGAINC